MKRLHEEKPELFPSPIEYVLPKVIREKIGEESNTLFISTACYSDNTKRLLDEIHERLRVSPNKAVKESFWELADDPLGLSICDWVREQQKIVNQRVMDALLYSVPKFTITPDGCKCEWGFCCNDSSIGNLVFINNYIDNPYSIIKLENEKETEKMDAKKCERCGKLYEMKDAMECISVYMPGIPVSDWTKENFTESRIRKDNTRIISVNFRGGEAVDLCPECREKLKNFFESGDNEKSVAVGLYGETVIKKAEE